MFGLLCVSVEQCRCSRRRIDRWVRSDGFVSLLSRPIVVWFLMPIAFKEWAVTVRALAEGE